MRMKLHQDQPSNLSFLEDLKDPCDMDRMFKYIRSVAKEPVTLVEKIEKQFTEVTYPPHPVKVMKSLLADLYCPTGCGSCCGKSDTRLNDPWVLNYIPHPLTVGTIPDNCFKTYFTVNGKEFQMWGDMTPMEDRWCHHLDQSDGLGRCGRYLGRPLECHMPPIQVNDLHESHGYYILLGRKFGWSHKMRKVDGTRGIPEAILPITEESKQTATNKLLMLQKFAAYFHIYNTWIPEILTWAENPTDEIWFPAKPEKVVEVEEVKHEELVQIV